MGRDIQRRVKVGKVCCFNPRARMGRDLERLYSVAILTSFNPRARMGRDIKTEREMCLSLPVSIHAPAWGATLASGRGLLP